MSTSDRVAELLAQAEALKEIAVLEDASTAATEAFRDDPTDPDLKAAHRDAAQALADKRQELRENPSTPPLPPGSTAISPAPANVGSAAAAATPGGDATQED